MPSNDRISNTGRGYKRRVEANFPAAISLRPAAWTRLFNEVSTEVSRFLAHRSCSDDRLSTNVSAKIALVVKARPHQILMASKAALAFWEALDNVYGPNGERHQTSIISLLDTWQAFLNASHSDTSLDLLEGTLLWLEEFDQSKINWDPARREIKLFPVDRIRKAARQFFAIHKIIFPNIERITDIRALREAAEREQKRDNSQPSHRRGEIISIPDEYSGNFLDYWPYPKQR